VLLLLLLLLLQPGEQLLQVWTLPASLDEPSAAALVTAQILLVLMLKDTMASAFPSQESAAAVECTSAHQRWFCLHTIVRIPHAATCSF
jgi:hypothetical protein